MKKKLVICLVAAAILAALVLCAVRPGKPVQLRSGSYFLEQEGEGIMIPYLYLDLTNNSAHLSGGMAISYAETGTLSRDGSQVLVDTGTTAYVFRVQDEKTLVLTDCAGENPFKLPAEGKLVYSDQWN